MRIALLIAFLLISSTSVAEVVKLSAGDASKVCGVLGSIYALQSGPLSNYPLARMVHVKNERPGVQEYTLGTSGEKVICRISIYHRPGSSTVLEEVKIQYNGDTTDFRTNHQVSLVSYAKAYEIRGNLAQVICANFEDFDAIEMQAAVPTSDQVFHRPTEPNAFGLEVSVQAPGVISCGSRDGDKILLVHTQGFI